MRELAIFSRQFATLVASGMPMLRTLHTLEQQSKDEKIKEAAAGLRADVEAGSTLEQGMDRHPQVFDRLFRAMVRSGEESGRLEDALDRIAFQVEKADSLRRQVKSAMMYPAMVFGVATVVLLADGHLHHSGLRRHLRRDRRRTSRRRHLSAAAHAGLRGGLRRDHQLLVRDPARAVVSIYGLFKWKKTEAGKEVWDRFLLRLPFKIGDVIQKVALARWSRTFSGSVSAGVPMLQSIKLTGETAGNVVVEQAMDDVYASVKRGGSLAGPIETNPIFPPMVGHMVAVGEETGQLEHMLTKIADFYEAEVDAKVKALTALLEPVMIVFVGGIVGFIVIAMYLPIFSLYDKIR